MPGPYVNQAPVDDDSEMRDDSDRPQGTDPQTMAILSRILSLLQAQTEIPPPQGMQPGADPMGMGGGMPPGPPPGMGGPPGMPPGMGGPPGAGGGGLPPELAAMLAGGGAGGGPPMPGPGMPPPGMGGPPPMPMPPPPMGGPGMPFTQYAQQRMGRM